MKCSDGKVTWPQKGIVYATPNTMVHVETGTVGDSAVWVPWKDTCFEVEVIPRNSGQTHNSVSPVHNDVLC